jgi:hypothetical protein
VKPRSTSRQMAPGPIPAPRFETMIAYRQEKRAARRVASMKEARVDMRMKALVDLSGDDNEERLRLVSHRLERAWFGRGERI